MPAGCRSFRKAGNQGAWRDDEFHGVGGPLNVCGPTVSATNSSRPLIAAASVEAGIPRNADFNGATQDGVGHYQATSCERGRRWDAAARLSEAGRRAQEPARDSRTPMPTRILIRGRTGRGGSIPAGGAALRLARCRGECDVCRRRLWFTAAVAAVGGSGPRPTSKEMGIPVAPDLPAVGANLHDHFTSFLRSPCAAPSPFTLNDLTRSPTVQGLKAPAAAIMAFGRTGHLRRAGRYAGAPLRVRQRISAWIGPICK
jgi:choline dehydrogenase